MIKLIEARYRAFFPNETEAMFRHRKRVFCDRLKWVECKLDREVDSFDDQNPLYMISVDPDTGLYRGSCRLLPTTGPNMLRDVPEFAALLDGGTIEAAAIWECSRICGENGTLAEMIVGMAEVGRLAGMTQIVAVFDARISRALRIAHCPFEVIGSGKIRDTICHAGLIDIDFVKLPAFQRRHALGSVVEAVGFMASFVPPSPRGWRLGTLAGL